jgi:hypothetical protein
MTTNQQVRRLMLLIKKGLPLSTAAVKAGMSEPTARKYRRAGKLPGELKASHSWRTRPDPFAEVWSEVEALLEREGGLEAKTVFEELGRRYPGRFRSGQLRTLQRRFRGWRALRGPEREVYFEQAHRPGEQCQSDFTDMGALSVRIAGEPFAHLLELGSGVAVRLRELRGAVGGAARCVVAAGCGAAGAPHGQSFGGHP